MEKLHTRMVQFSSNKFGNIVPIQAIPGHFVTSHSHVNYFIDLTMLKSSQEDAQKCAHALASQYKDIDSIDTIICLDGTGIIGAFLSVNCKKRHPLPSTKRFTSSVRNVQTMDKCSFEKMSNPWCARKTSYSLWLP